MNKPVKIVSVIIATYNRKDTVLRAVQSALNQTSPPAEVIVVDDGSTDGTRELIEGLSGVRYIWQPNQRQAVARNNALSTACGDVIAVLDSDDWWDTDHLESALGQMQRHQVPVYIANWRELDEHGVVTQENGMSQMEAMRSYLNQGDEDGYLALEDSAARWLTILHQPAPSSAMILERRVVRGWDTVTARWIRDDLLFLIEGILEGKSGCVLGTSPTWNKSVTETNMTNSDQPMGSTLSWLRAEQCIYERISSRLKPDENRALRAFIARLAFDHAYSVSRQRPLQSIPFYWESFSWAASPRPLFAAAKQLLRLGRSR